MIAAKWVIMYIPVEVLTGFARGERQIERGHVSGGVVKSRAVSIV